MSYLEATCQRCHETLRDADRYCPVCGLPQLMYVAAELPVRALGSEEGDEAVAVGGVPFTSMGGKADLAGGDVLGGIGAISWKPALRAALLMGIPAGVICSQLTPFGSSSLSLLWMMSAAAWAVSMYVKRSRLGRLSLGSGVRIGLVTGLFAAWLALGLDGANLWVQRFLLHRGSQMNAAWIEQVDTGLQLNQQLFTQMGMATTQVTQVLQMNRTLMLSPDGHAGVQLWELVFGSITLTFFAIVGGAMGARFLVPRGRTSVQR